MKVALVHDYLVSFGGAERVLKAMLEIWPEADIFTAVVDPKIIPKLQISKQGLTNRVQVPSVSRLPFVGKFYKLFTFFYPLVFESFDLSLYDVVISSSSNFAKGVITKPNQLHICYCHTVPRFLWGYPTETNWRRHLIFSKILLPLDSYLRLWDFWAAQRVDYFVANSQTVASRIRKFYRRAAEVIYPPVELEPGDQEGRKAGGQEYYLVVSRLSAYKNVHLAIESSKRKGLPLKVVGTGREEQNLKKLAKGTPQIEFLGEVTDAELVDLYRGCLAVICPTQDEDFGIVPLEAASFGKPVIALRSGGYKETVIEAKTGLFFAKPTVESLISAVEQFEENLDFYQSQELQKNASAWAQNFSLESFKKKLQALVEEKLLQLNTL